MSGNIAPLKGRGDVCLCCSKKTSQIWPEVTSAFLAHRALEERQTVLEVAQCPDCNFIWSLRGLSDVQVSKLYVGYRSDEYFHQRHSFEPWYSRSKNESMGSDAEMYSRREVLAAAIAACEQVHGQRPRGISLDYGGDRGQLLKDLPDKQKWVFDVSGHQPDAWASQVKDLPALQNRCDLVLNCQVLEHVNNPLDCLKESAALISKTGWIYIEVPDEAWTQHGWLPVKIRKAWLELLCKSDMPFKAIDFVSTASRIAFGFIPFFGFWAMREHLNFFTIKSLACLMKAADLNVLWIEKTPSGISAIGTRRSSR